MVSAILIIIVFIILCVLMIMKKISALIAMPLMAFFIALISGLFSGLPFFGEKGKCVADFIFVDVISKGSFRLAEAMMYAGFGAILSRVVMTTGVAEKLVKTAAELAGDKKFVVALILTVASAIVFGSVSGLGGFIMIASLVLPVMTASGISAPLSACLLLFSLSIGGIFNPANWGFYKDALGIDLEVVKNFSISYAIILSVVALIFLIFELRREKRVVFWAVKVDETENKLSPFALITPILPIILIINPLYSVPVVPAFIISALYGAMVSDLKNTINTITSSIIEGLKDIAPVFGLFIGIGMLLNAVSAPYVTSIMQPLLKSVVPSNPVWFIVFFFLLSPLALYRGPFNLYGLGSGLAAVLVSSNILPAPAVMGAFLSVGQIQGICDPTNTQNVWIAQYMKVSVEDLMKKTIPYVLGFVLISLIWAVVFGGILK